MKTDKVNRLMVSLIKFIDLVIKKFHNDFKSEN